MICKLVEAHLIYQNEDGNSAANNPPQVVSFGGGYVWFNNMLKEAFFMKKNYNTQGRKMKLHPFPSNFEILALHECILKVIRVIKILISFDDLAH